MARNRHISAIARGASMSAEIWLKLDRAVKGRGGTDEDIHRLATPSGDVALTCMVEELLRTEEATGAHPELPYYDKARGLYHYAVDCGGGGEDDFVRLLNGCRFDDCSNPMFKAENFPLATRGRWGVTAKLVHLNAVVHTRNVLGTFTELSLLRPDPEHVLGFATAFPDVQRRFPVVGLVSFPWKDDDGDLVVPTLWDHDRVRKLSLYRFDAPWVNYSRFIALLSIRRLPT